MALFASKQTMGSRERKVFVEATNRGPLVSLVVAFNAASAEFALVRIDVTGRTVARGEVWKDEFTLSAVRRSRKNFSRLSVTLFAG